jgi:hypothetical protein
LVPIYFIIIYLAYAFTIVYTLTVLLVICIQLSNELTVFSLQNQKLLKNSRKLKVDISERLHDLVPTLISDQPDLIAINDDMKSV